MFVEGFQEQYRSYCNIDQLGFVEVTSGGKAFYTIDSTGILEEDLDQNRAIILDHHFLEPVLLGRNRTTVCIAGVGRQSPFKDPGPLTLYRRGNFSMCTLSVIDKQHLLKFHLLIHPSVNRSWIPKVAQLAHLWYSVSSVCCSKYLISSSNPEGLEPINLPMRMPPCQ